MTIMAKQIVAHAAYTKAHKYGAKRTTVDGIHFDSKAEAYRYGELLLMEKRGDIHNLRPHPRYPLHAGPDNVARVGDYVADFEYQVTKTGVTITEDVKGVRTDLFKWKAKHFAIEYGRQVHEIGRRA